MKLVTFLEHGVEALGAVVGDRVLRLDALFSSLVARAPAGKGSHASCAMTRLIELDGPEFAAVRREVARAAAGAQSPLLLSEIALQAPVPRPGKIVAVGRNYADHAAETGVKPFEKPRIIAKLPSSVCGPGSTVRRPPGVQKLDFEVELAVVIGRAARQVAKADALACVAGYTILDDVSAREFQFDVAPPQTTFAKSMDDFCPMGPWLVTADEVSDPQDLDLRLELNGEPMQSGNTRNMIFSVATLIEYITSYMTLEPGDVIATGTPAGIGAFRKPPRWLQPGDRLALDITRIGRLEHAIG